MAEHSRSISQELQSVLGFGALSKICKQLVSKYHHKKNSAPERATSKDESKFTEEESEVYEHSNYNPANKNNMHAFVSPKGIFENQNDDNMSTQSTPSLSRSKSPLSSRNASPLRSRSTSPSSPSKNRSRRSHTLMRIVGTSLLRIISWKNSSVDSSITSSLPRLVSQRSSTSIMYSNSRGVVKPPAMEETLECTLEELWFGCIKKIKTTRNAVTNDGQIMEEHKVLTIKVKPGWKNGTKITFEGTGNETPGALHADIIFTIVEKQHYLFRREGDDLELAIEIPLVEALTCCTLAILLLGEEKITLPMDDIVHPGYKKIIGGQGMAKPQGQAKRGNLIITFSVKFPIKLTKQQHSDIVNILQDSF